MNPRCNHVPIRGDEVYWMMLRFSQSNCWTWKWRGYFWQLDNFFITITHWNQMCVCVSIMHQLEATRKANPKEYEATVYISSYISTYRDNTRERKQWLILTISTAWPSGIPLNQGAGGTSWCWHQASSNAWGHNPDWLAMSPSPTQYPFTSIHHRAHRGPAPHHISFFPANFATFWNPIAVIPLVSIFHVT